MGIRCEEDMEINEIKQHIKSGQFDPFYIFCGEEYQIIKIYLKMIAEKANLELTYVDSLMDLMTGAKTKSLIKVSHLYIIMDDKEFLTNDKMWDRFKGLKDDIVVFYYTSADKRLKFWKTFKDRVVEFPRLDEPVLIKYIKKEIPLSEENCKILMDVCGRDYGRILLEIDKIKAYSQAEKVKADYALHKLIDEGVIWREPYDAIFDFVSAVLERNPAKALNLLEQSYGVGEANMILLSVLYNNFKTLLQVQSSNESNRDAWKVKAYKGNYSNGEILRAMRIIRFCEKGIKTGQMPDEYSVYYVLVNVM